MHSQIEAYFVDKETELLEAICRLVRIPSMQGPPAPHAPFGFGPAAALEEALALAAEWGLQGQNLEGYVGVVDVQEGTDALHILAHLDVVAPGPGWTVTEAFSPLRVGDLLYGRGTSDDKGPLVAALFALRAVKELQLPLSKNVRLILGTDEESGMRDIAWYYDRHPHAPHAFSPDANFPVYTLEKGHWQPHLYQSFSDTPKSGARLISLTSNNPVNMVPPVAQARLFGLSGTAVETACRRFEQESAVRFVLTAETDGLLLICHGRAAHASTPEEGENALTALLSLLCQLPLDDCTATHTLHILHNRFPHGEHEGAALGLQQSDASSGPLTLCLSIMDWQENGFTARFDVRTPLCATEESTLRRAEAVFTPHGMHLDGPLSPAHYVSEDSAFVQTLLRCYELYSGRSGACLSMGGGTYVHEIPGGVAFGASMPGFFSHLHEADERVSLSDLLAACKIFTQVIAELCC